MWWWFWKLSHASSSAPAAWTCSTAPTSGAPIPPPWTPVRRSWRIWPHSTAGLGNSSSRSKWPWSEPETCWPAGMTAPPSTTWTPSMTSEDPTLSTATRSPTQRFRLACWTSWTITCRRLISVTTCTSGRGLLTLLRISTPEERPKTLAGSVNPEQRRVQRRLQWWRQPLRQGATPPRRLPVQQGRSAYQLQIQQGFISLFHLPRRFPFQPRPDPSPLRRARRQRPPQLLIGWSEAWRRPASCQNSSPAVEPTLGEPQLSLLFKPNFLCVNSSFTKRFLSFHHVVVVICCIILYICVSILKKIIKNVLGTLLSIKKKKKKVLSFGVIM